MEINQNENRSTNLTKRAAWEKHYASYQASGLKKKTYCRNTGLNYYQFQYWHQKFQLEQRVESNEPATGFLPVAIKSPRRTSDILCTLELSSGSRLFIHDESVLQTILVTLR